MIAPLLWLLGSAALAAPDCRRLAAGWGSVDQALSALPLETACADGDALITAAEAWHAATRAAASRRGGPPGCAQVLGEPRSREELERALAAVAPDTPCVDVDGAVAVLRPSVTSGQPVPRTLDRWQPRAAIYRPCEGEQPALPCLDDAGVLRAEPSFLKALVRPMPRLGRAIRQGMAEEGLSHFEVSVYLSVDAEGRVQSLRWLDGPSWAEPAVTRALLRWRFEPVSSGGEPSPVALELRLRLGRREPPALADEGHVKSS